MNRFIGIGLLALIGCFKSEAAPVTALAFSPDGRTLASSGHKRVDLRTVDDGEVRDSVACSFPRVTSLAFLDNDTLIVGGGVPGVSGTASIVKLSTKAATRTFDGHSDLVTSVAVNPNREWLAVGSADHAATIHLLSTSGPPKTITLAGHSAPVLAVAFAPDGQMVITGSADRSIKIWNVEGKLIRSFNHHTEAVHALAIRPSDGIGPVECASGSDDGSVRIWQPAIGRMVRIIRGHGGPIFALAYMPDGKALYSGGKEGIIRKIAIDSDQILLEQRASTNVIYSLAISPSGGTLASGDWVGEVRVVGPD